AKKHTMAMLVRFSPSKQRYDRFLDNNTGPSQSGGGLIDADVYDGYPVYQLGHGFGSFMGSLFKHVLPVAQRILPHAVRFGTNVIGDLQNGRPVREALRERGVDALKSAASDILLQQKGSGGDRKRTKRVKGHVHPAKRKRIAAAQLDE